MYSSEIRVISSRRLEVTTIHGYFPVHSMYPHSTLETATTVSTSSIRSPRQTRMSYLKSRSFYVFSPPRRNANYKLSSLPAHLDRVSIWIRAGLSRYSARYSVSHSRFSSPPHASCIKLIVYIIKSSWRYIHVRNLVAKLPKRLGMRLRMMSRDWVFPSPGRHPDGARKPQEGSWRGIVTRESKRPASDYTSIFWISERLSLSRRPDHLKSRCVPSKRRTRNSSQTS